MTVAEPDQTDVADHPTIQPVASAVSFDAFYRTHRDSVARTLALTLGDHGLGYEAADEAMVRAYERWSTVGLYDNPEGWVYRTGLNWATSLMRWRKRAKRRDPLLARPDHAEDRRRDLDLRQALAGLPRDQRAVVVLRYYRDWSVDQTAQALGIAPGTVKSRAHRALTDLNHSLTATTGELS